jgi:muramoyltetrapeptide carboxypeptidase
MLIRPKRLEPGDTIGIVAPASAPPDPKNIDGAVAFLEQLGFKVKLASNVRKRLGFLAGTDRERAGDLMRMFADRHVNAILCVRGGYGTARLLPLLDYRVIRANSKIFVGYSDVTSLHCALLTKANLISFHGPMLNSDFSRPDMPKFTLQSFLRTLGGDPASSIQHPVSSNIAAGYRHTAVKVLRRGLARGQLVGGNLSVLCTTIGTPWQTPFRGRILFFEDVGEQPYRFDRMLTHLLNCDLLQQVAGIAIGINHDCGDPKAKRTREYRQTLEDVFRERLLLLKVPVVLGLPFGHGPHNATLPFGANATLDATRGNLVITEPVVT